MVVRIARAGSWIISPARAATIVAPRIRPPTPRCIGRGPPMSLTNPAVWPVTTARSTSSKGRNATRAAVSAQSGLVVEVQADRSLRLGRLHAGDRTTKLDMDPLCRQDLG